MSHPVDPKTGEPIFHSHGVGLRNVGSYQISGHPYVSGSGDLHGTAQAARTIKRFQFPFVSREVTIRAKPDNGPWQYGNHQADAAFVSASYVWVAFASGSGHAFSDEDDVVTYQKESDIILGNHYISVTGSYTIEAKLKEIYVIVPDAGAATSYEVIANLTNVPTQRMYHLTGSGITDCPQP